MSAAYEHQVLVPLRVRVPKRLLLATAGQPSVKCHVVGSCRQLGDWNLEKALAMQPARQQQQQQQQLQEEESVVFARDVQIPLRTGDIQYRFFLASCHDPNDEDSEVTLCVAYWETHEQPRRLSLMDCITGRARPEIDIPEMGMLDGRLRLQRGWLTGQTQVHLRLVPGSIEWYTPAHRRRLREVLVHCSTYSVAGDTVCEYSSHLAPEESPSPSPSPTGDSMQLGELEDSLTGFESVARQPALVSAMREGECGLAAQSPDGCRCSPDDFLVFQLDTFDLENAAYQFDFRDPATGNVVASAKLMPLKSLDYSGVKILQILGSRRGSPLIGCLKVNYLIISSMAPHLRNDMSRTFRKHWRRKRTVNVGHRGSGNSSSKAINSVRENTIHSMNLAAERGAEFVEFDVQLSKDKVPVVFHDFNVAVTMRLKQKKLRQVEMPVKNFTVHSLQSMKLCATSEMTDNEDKLDTDDVDPQDLQPFPSLRQCLEQVHSSTGFLVELKYPQRLLGGQLEGGLEHYAERNFYVNRVLADLLQFAGSRRILLSTFDADCCAMLQLKQPRYPVLFATQGRSRQCPAYADPRCGSTLASAYHAVSLDILGLSASVEELLEDQSLVARVQACGLVLFLWGQPLDSADTVARFRRLGADAVICDYIHADTELPPASVFVHEVSEASDKSRSSSSSPAQMDSRPMTPQPASAACGNGRVA